MKRRVLACLTALVMAINMIPSSALAVQAGETEQPAAVEETVPEEEEESVQDSGGSDSEEQAVEDSSDGGGETSEMEETASEETASDQEEEAEEASAEEKEAVESEEPAAEEETAESDEPAVEEEVEYFEGTLSYQPKDKNYQVKVECGKDAKIPAGAELKVEEIKKDSDEYQDYLDEAAEAVEKEVAEARFFDISIWSDGQEVTPSDSVKVSITYKKAISVSKEDNGEVTAIHFDEKKDEPEVLDTETNKGSEVKKIAFEAESFSVYGVIYTVEFTYDGFTYSIEGNGEILLSDLLKELNIEVDNIENAEVALEKAVGDTDDSALYLTGSANDGYVLHSDAAFDDTYSLTVKADLSTYVIEVTDQAGTHSFNITVDNDVTLTQDTYVVFMQGTADSSSTIRYYYYKIPRTGSFDGSFSQMKQPYQDYFPFDTDIPLTVIIAEKKDQWTADISSEYLFQNNASGLYERYNTAANKGVIEGKNVKIETNGANTSTTIRIGGAPVYDADFVFKNSDGTDAEAATLEGRYFILATTEDSTTYVAEVDPGNDLVFNLPQGEELHKVSKFKVYRYDAGNSDSSASDIISNGVLINDGGDLGDNSIYKITYPEMNPSDRVYHFIATKVDVYDGAAIQFYSDVEGTTEESDPSIPESYFLVAKDGDNSVAYAPITGNGELNFTTDGSDTVNLRDGYTYALQTGTPSLTGGTDAGTKVGDYTIDLTPEVVENEGAGSLLFKATLTPKYPAVIEHVGAVTPPDNYYIVAFAGDEPIAYAKVPSEAGKLTFTDGTDTDVEFSEGTTFKLVTYEGEPALDSLSSAEDQGRNLGDSYSLDIPTVPSKSGEDMAYVFTAAGKGGLTATVQITDYDNELLTPDPAITGYYIRVKIQEKTNEVDDSGNPVYQDVGWTLIPTGSISSGETTFTVDKYVSLQKNPLSTSLTDSDWTEIDLSKNRVDLSDKYAVRMITIQNPNSISKYEDAVADDAHADNITDDAPEGYDWKGISAVPEGSSTPVGFIIKMQESKNKDYIVRLKFEGASAVDDIPTFTKAGEGSTYVKVTIKHASGTPDTYGFVKLTDDMKKVVTGDDGTYVVVDVPINTDDTNRWIYADGRVATDERFTGNEAGLTVELVHYKNGPGRILPNSPDGKVLAENEYLNNAKVVHYPITGEKPDRIKKDNESVNSREYVYDIVTLKKVDDKLSDYSLEFLLNHYNVVTLCPNESGPGFGPGDFEHNQHLVGGILVRGDFFCNIRNNIGTSPASTSPSAVGGSVKQSPALYDGIIGGGQSVTPGKENMPFYIGDENTVYGGVNSGFINEYPGINNLNTYGATIVNEEFVDWEVLQQSVIDQSVQLAEASTDAEVVDGIAYVTVGEHVTLPAGVTKVILYSGDPSTNTAWWKDAKGTVLTIESSGNVTTPAIEFRNGTKESSTPQTFTGGDNGEGLSLVWNIPYSTGDIHYTPNSAWGHIIAPKANAMIGFDDGVGNFNGSLLVNSARLKAEGHMWPYRGGKLVPSTVGLVVHKTVNGETPTEQQVYTFELEELKAGAWSHLQTKQNDKGTITFDEIRYGAEATHWYRLYEKTAGVSGKPDTTWYVLKVVVTKKIVGDDTIYEQKTTAYKVTDQENLLIEREINPNAITETGEGETLGSAEDITFINEEYGSLKIKKIVNGDDAKGSYKIAVKNSEGHYFDTDGTDKGTTAFYVTFVKNQEKTWQNLLKGTYTVEEEDASATGYTWTVSGSNNDVTVSPGKESSANVTNTYLKHTDAEIKAKKKFTGRAWKTGDSFEFTLAPVDGAPMPSDAETVDGVKQKKITATSDAAVSFGKIDYTEAGTYEYTITETKGNLPGVTYDTAPKTVTVTVRESEGKHLAATVTYAKGTDAQEITNTFEAVTEHFEATKSINNWGTAKSFTFTLSATNPTVDAPMPESGRTATATKDNLTAVFGDITYDAPGTYFYTIKETDDHVPGITYDTSEHLVKVEVSQNSDTNKLTAAVTYGTDNADRLEITNTFTKAQAELKATKSINEWGNATSFTFNLTSVDGAPMPKEKDPATGTETEVTSRTVTKQNLTAIFGTIEYDRVGQYKYTITEADDHVPGVTYDTSPHEVIVDVHTANDSNALVAVVTYDGQSSLTITNRYASANLALQATKSINEWGDAESFTFNLAAGKSIVNGVEGTSPMPEPNGRTAKATKTNTTAVFGSIKYEEAGTYNYTITEDDDHIAGITYDTTPHVVVVTVERNADGDLEPSAKYDGKDSLTITNTFTSIKKQFEATKSITEWGKADSFTFILADASEGAPMPASNTASVTKGGSMTAVFGEIEYKTTGEYDYTITEQNDHVDGVTYDTTSHPVHVSVTKNETTNALEATVTYGEGEDQGDSLTITNKFTAAEAELKATKDFNAWGKANEFNFELKAVSAVDATDNHNAISPIPVPAALTATATSANKTASFGKAKYEQAGTYTYEITEVNGGVDGVSYDTTPHTVVVKVEKDPDTNALTATVKYDKDKSKLTSPTPTHPPRRPSR